jgi:5-methylcytosine-specific restriction protein B
MQEEQILPPPGIEGEPLSSWSVRAPFRNDAFDRLVGKARTLNVTDLEVAGESKE